MTINTKEPFEFTGWIEHIGAQSEYEQRFSVANYKSAGDKESMRSAHKVPLAFEFSVKKGSKTQELLNLLGIGDDVRVKFRPYGRSGTSKKTGSYYCINAFNVLNEDGIDLIKKAKPIENRPTTINDVRDGDCPF